jgi:CelD/BcsL family acetyltransferase involved in cellulose biosynthesis
MIRIYRANSAQELKRLRGLWESLAESTRTVFEQYVWAYTAASVFGEREVPSVIALENDAGVAIIPAVKRGESLRFLGETLFDYRNVIGTGDRTLMQRAWEELGEMDLPLNVTALRGEQARSEWLEFTPTFFCNAPAVRRSETSAEEFMAAHSRLGRQIRRLYKQGVVLHRYYGNASNVVSWIYERKAQQADSVFTDPLRREFMVRICAAEPFKCDIFTYQYGGECIAALVTFRHRQMRHFYTIYFDPKWAQMSPGQVLVYEATARSLAEGFDCDYMTGEYAYKNRLATHMEPLYRVQISAERLAEIAGKTSEMRAA